MKGDYFLIQRTMNREGNGILLSQLYIVVLLVPVI